MIGELLGKKAAEKVQLQMQYDPKPPFDCGTPQKAPHDLVQQILKQNRYEERQKIISNFEMKHKNDKS